MIASRQLLRYCRTLTVIGFAALGLAACGDLLTPDERARTVEEVSPLEPPPAGIIPAGGQGWASVTVGRDHSCALDMEGGAYCWGSNTHAQLGTDTAEPLCGPPAARCVRTPTRVGTSLRFRQISAGGMHTCGITTGGAAYCWGSNARGQLGTPSPQLAGAPVPVNSSRRWLTISAGVDHTCGIIEGGALFCWGDNETGQLGVETFTTHYSPARVRPQTTFAEVAAGSERTCAIAVDGTLFCWGFVWSYTLAGIDFGSPATFPNRVPRADASHDVSMGLLHSCSLVASGQAECWGSGLFGQRGDGGVSGSTFPRAVRGGLTFHSVSAGSIQTCGVAADRRAWCWGNNSFGQLGATVADECQGTPCTTMPVLVETPLRWIDVQTGIGNHVCGITTLTNIYCWGLGTNGQLGNGVAGTVWRRRPELVNFPRT